MQFQTACQRVPQLADRWEPQGWIQEAGCCLRWYRQPP
ncbi:hypothetical protein E2C01_080078 [Portunus trituberculatus]|uniref:Uncharacterized protein n=1 Tax=Portunus trituberculatus TaxID=210409 RepID=A0A5B7IXF9_PORTR|nr:hypothetical protein [Portunus trituberculatus]